MFGVPIGSKYLESHWQQVFSVAIANSIGIKCLVFQQVFGVGIGSKCFLLPIVLAASVSIPIGSKCLVFGVAIGSKCATSSVSACCHRDPTTDSR